MKRVGINIIMAMIALPLYFFIQDILNLKAQPYPGIYNVSLSEYIAHVSFPKYIVLPVSLLVSFLFPYNLILVCFSYVKRKILL